MQKSSDRVFKIIKIFYRAEQLNGFLYNLVLSVVEFIIYLYVVYSTCLYLPG